MSTLSLGRDFVRLLHAVSAVPAFKLLLKDMQTNPSQFHPEFYGLLQYCRIITADSYIVSLLTKDMEFKIHFLLNNVDEKMYMPYLSRFKAKYLGSQDSETLYPDIIRYICRIVSPRVEILRSKILQRWQIIRTLICFIQVRAKTQIFAQLLFFLTVNSFRTWFFVNLPNCLYF